jgi:hypothetical protein
VNCSAVCPENFANHKIEDELIWLCCMKQKKDGSSVGVMLKFQLNPKVFL